ncbi:hypothetical protein SCALM49S_03860 [Streptomyces californicus]
MRRATTVQACGLWPFAAGSGAPMTGVPLGQHLHTGATVCGDPISWFTRARYISNLSLFMLGMPGLGKSTLVNPDADRHDGHGLNCAPVTRTWSWI